MSTESLRPERQSIGSLPEGEAARQNVSSRQRRGRIWQGILMACTIFGIIILLMLAYNIVNDAFGGIGVQYAVEEEDLTNGQPLEELSQAELIAILETNLRSRVLKNLERERPLAERSREELIDIINDEIIKPEVVAVYSLSEFLFDRPTIEAELRESHPRAEIEFKSWLSWDFIVTPMSSNAVEAGIRTAILGTLYLLWLTMLISFPLGVGTAIYLEEYKNDKPFDERIPAGRWMNNAIQRSAGLIETNIYNLSGVPSIIYGILGLAIFVRALEQFTSGAVFGYADPTTANGRTILSAALTMSLLVLPVVIISSQEAIRAVPGSMRQASYGLGATKWQTVWKIVLPNAMPGILTGTILSISRAIGETAPLIVIGASTSLSPIPPASSPSLPFCRSRFTTGPHGPSQSFVRLPPQVSLFCSFFCFR